MPTVDELRTEVNTTTKDDPVLARCLTLAAELVGEHTKGVAPGKIPAAVLDEAVLITAVDQFNRRKAPNGILNQQFAGSDGTQAVPVRVSRDPFNAMRPLLRPWVGGGGVRTVRMGGPFDE